MKCSKCGLNNEEGVNFCGGCGNNLNKQELKCNNCGYLYKNETKYCNNCGAKIDNENISVILKEQQEKYPQEQHNQEQHNQNNSKNNNFIVLFIIIIGAIVLFYLLPILFGLGVGASLIKEGLSNEGVVNVQDNIGTVSESMFTDYDQKIVTGTQVVSAYKKFQGKAVAILINTQAMTKG